VKLEGPVLYAWLAALIDGEGSVMLNKRTVSERMQKIRRHARRNVHYRATVSICNTNYDLMTALVSNTGIDRVYQHRINGPKDRPRARASWTWRLAHDDSREWLPLIRPFLVLKGPQVDLLLEALNIKRQITPGNAGFHPSERGKLITRLGVIYATIRKLNTKGRSLGNE
jgi:hypothetical protein